MLFSPYIYLNDTNKNIYNNDNDNDNNNLLTLKEINELNKNSKRQIKAITLGYITNLDFLKNELPHIIEFIENNGTLTLSIGGIDGPFIQETMTQIQILTFLSTLITETECYRLDFTIEENELLEIHNIDKLNKSIFQLQQNSKNNIYISYTIPISRPEWNSINNNGISFINNIVSNGIKDFTINAMLMNLYIKPIDNNIIVNYDWIKIIESMKLQLLSIFPNKNEQEIYNMIGVCPLIKQQDDNYIFDIIDIKNITDYALKNNLNLLSYLTLQRDNNYEYYDTITDILYPIIPSLNYTPNYSHSSNYSSNYSPTSYSNSFSRSLKSISLDSKNSKKEIKEIKEIKIEIKDIPNFWDVLSHGYSENINYEIKKKQQLDIINSNLPLQSLPQSHQPQQSLPQSHQPQQSLQVSPQQSLQVSPQQSLQVSPQQSLPQSQQSLQFLQVSHWESGKIYNINDVVIYNSIKYKCNISHTSIITWKPNIKNNLWIYFTPLKI